MEKENRRAKITKLLLTDSFLHLLEQKPLPRITGQLKTGTEGRAEHGLGAAWPTVGVP